MAKVIDALPRPEVIHTVDVKKLVEDDELPPPELGPAPPKQLRAFVVLKDPKMTVIPNFFTKAECEHVIRLVEGFWMPSLVGQATNSSDEDYAKGNLENALSQTRTSWSCMLRYAQNSVVERLEHRVARMAGLPVDNMERLNMVRYAPGELFDEHHDGKFRPRTIFVYLNDLPPDEEAGDTFFPVLGLSFKPSCGTAVMWSNNDPEHDREDSRMLHAGRAPTKGVKYGVNCFVNAYPMRHILPSGDDVSLEKSVFVQVSELANDSEPGTPRQLAGDTADPSKLTAYRLVADPKILAIPQFLKSDEVEHLLHLVNSGTDLENVATREPFAGATETLRTLEAEETSVVHEVECRLATYTGFSINNLARLRIVKVGTTEGLCNRGCGPRAVYTCLSDVDEVFFPRLGIRLGMCRGDAIIFPNVNWDSGSAMEDIRTLRVHVPCPDRCGEPVLGLDAYFHDNQVREQQRQRQFVSD